MHSPGSQLFRRAARDRHWGIFTDLCAEARAKGNLVQDAWFAALAIESGCEWVTPTATMRVPEIALARTVLDRQSSRAQ